MAPSAPPEGKQMQDEEDTTRTVGLVADPGIAQSFADRICHQLEERLNKLGEYAYSWKVIVDPLTLPQGESGRAKFDSIAPKLRAKNGWDYIIYLTDGPHYEQNRPVRSVISPQQTAAALSIPALGIATPCTVSKALVEVVQELATGTAPTPNSLERAFSFRGRMNDADEHSKINSIEGLSGRLWLALGMIRSNRPWRLVPQLSSAMAGAAATGAFGVFYTSIWQMADYLSNQRLALITVSSIAMLSFWLIFHNRLWERPEGHRRKERKLVYNVATVLTVALAATIMYLILFLALFTASLVVIDQEFLASQVEHEVSLVEYLNLAWLAASLGTMGGAIGSSFDDAKLVQQATFSQREYERRNLHLEEEDAKE